MRPKRERRLIPIDQVGGDLSSHALPLAVKTGIFAVIQQTLGLATVLYQTRGLSSDERKTILKNYGRSLLSLDSIFKPFMSAAMMELTNAVPKMEAAVLGVTK
jgi:hypothetical protein